MSTFKLPKDPHASVGRGPGSPGCVEVSRGCVTSGRCLSTLSSVLSSVNRGGGAEEQTHQSSACGMDVLQKLFRGEEFLVTLNLSVTIAFHLSCSYILWEPPRRYIPRTSGNVRVWPGREGGWGVMMLKAKRRVWAKAGKLGCV